MFDMDVFPVDIKFVVCTAFAAKTLLRATRYVALPVVRFAVVAMTLVVKRALAANTLLVATSEIILRVVVLIVDA